MATKLQGSFGGNFENECDERIEILMYLFYIPYIKCIMGNSNKIFHITKYNYKIGVRGFKSSVRNLYIEKQEEILSVEI